MLQHMPRNTKSLFGSEYRFACWCGFTLAYDSTYATFALYVHLLNDFPESIADHYLIHKIAQL